MWDLLLRRADYRCEYCRLPLLGNSWQVDHIIPKSLGGTDDFNNLAVACFRCNNNKRNQFRIRDPVTGLEVPLFNPRKEHWEHHFIEDKGRIIGKTPIGRATATLLFRMTPHRIAPDLRWEPILQISDENLYCFLNDQRARRLSNRFDSLEKAITTPNIIDKVSPLDKRMTRLALDLLWLELLYTRSQVKDVSLGIQSIEQILKHPSLTAETKYEFYNIRSILFQQLATIFALKGNYSKATQLQNFASKAYSTALSYVIKPSLFHRLRYKTLHSKYNPVTEQLFTKEDFKIASEEARTGYLRSLFYIVDSLLCAPRHTRKLENILRVTEESLQVCGYGQDFNIATGISLRRRWWILRLLTGAECDLTLFSRDIDYWRSANMHNEIRSMALSLKRIEPFLKVEIIRDMLRLID
jgi:hypothetical protein